MVHYLALEPLQEPGDLGELDEDGRVQYEFNMLATKRPSSTFLKELIEVLEAAGVGIEGETIFASSKVTIPTVQENPAPILWIRSTGGAGPLGTHNDGAGAYRRPGVQVIARAASEAAASALAHAAYNALIDVRNQAVSA
jgi:hypothetical protein